MSIYQTIKRPVIISEKQIDTILESFRKENNQEKVFLLNDAMAYLWQSLSQRIADEIEANMELSDSVEEIAKVIINSRTGLNVTRLGVNEYEVSSEETGAKTWLVENESGEIFLNFLPAWKDSRLLTARDSIMKNYVPSHLFVDITEMGPETASIFVEKVFSAYQGIVAKNRLYYPIES